MIDKKFAYEELNLLPIWLNKTRPKKIKNALFNIGLYFFKELNLRNHFRYSPRCPICRYDIRDYCDENNNSNNNTTNTTNTTNITTPYNVYPPI